MNLANGKLIENLEVAEVPLYLQRDILVELQQYSIFLSDAYKYYTNQLKIYLKITEV